VDAALDSLLDLGDIYKYSSFYSRDSENVNMVGRPNSIMLQGFLVIISMKHPGWKVIITDSLLGYKN
jgi:hypothetical protein